MVGDVVLTPFPFTDLSEIKIRPAVVLAGVGMRDWVLCEITSSSQVRDLYVAIGPGDMTTGKLKLGEAGPAERRGVRKELGSRPEPVLTTTVNDGCAVVAVPFREGGRHRPHSPPPSTPKS